MYLQLVVKTFSHRFQGEDVQTVERPADHSGGKTEVESHFVVIPSKFFATLVRISWTVVLQRRSPPVLPCMSFSCDARSTEEPAWIFFAPAHVRM